MEIVTPKQTLTLKKLLLETTRITKSQAGLFLGLSSFFVLPLSAAKLIYPKIIHNFILSTLIGKHNTTTQGNSHVYPSELYFLGLVLFLFNYFFSPCAIASITYAVFHGFNNEPIKIKPAIKSISASYFPLLATNLLSQSIIFTFTFLFIYLVFALGFYAKSIVDLSTSSATFLIYFPALTIFFILVMYLQVIWSVASPVIVVELSWGFEALARSNALIKGIKGLVWAWSLIFVVFSFVFWKSNSLVVNWLLSYLDNSNDHDDFGGLSLCLLLSLASLMLIQLYTTIANTVLYVYCKGFNTPGGYEFSGKYSILPVKDHNVASIV